MGEYLLCAAVGAFSFTGGMIFAYALLILLAYKSSFRQLYASQIFQEMVAYLPELFPENAAQFEQLQTIVQYLLGIYWRINECIEIETLSELTHIPAYKLAVIFKNPRRFVPSRESLRYAYSHDTTSEFFARAAAHSSSEVEDTNWISLAYYDSSDAVLDVITTWENSRFEAAARNVTQDGPRAAKTALRFARVFQNVSLDAYFRVPPGDDCNICMNLVKNGSLFYCCGYGHVTCEACYENIFQRSRHICCFCVAREPNAHIAERNIKSE